MFGFQVYMFALNFIKKAEVLLSAVISATMGHGYIQFAPCTLRLGNNHEK
jgi:hypothetical protein